MKLQSQAPLPLRRRILRRIYRVPHIGDVAKAIATFEATKSVEEIQTSVYFRDPRDHIEDSNLVGLLIENLRRNNVSFGGNYKSRVGDAPKEVSFNTQDYVSLQRIISEGYENGKYMNAWLNIKPRLREGILDFDIGTVIAPSNGIYIKPARIAKPHITGRIFFALPQ